MKTIVMVCAMVLSMAGGYALFAQTVKEVTFRITDIPAHQGKILLITESGRYCSAVDATSSAVELKIENMPNGEYTVYVYHDANSNLVLDKDANQIPVERCAIRKIWVTDQERMFQIILKDIQKQVKDK